MKKVIVIGASGSLAEYVIDVLSHFSDVELTLFLRNKRRLVNRPPGAKVVEGDVMNYNTLKAAIENQDIVYVNLAGDLNSMSANIVKAMQQAGVQRVIAISSIGIYKEPLKSVLRPYRALADNFEASGLDYTIIRPDWFTNGDEVNYHITKKPEPEIGGALSRKSIAAFVAKLINNPDLHVKENLGISKLQ
ncbi:MAG: NAD-dependent dehydratase [Crocinitomicaceae bacterium]|nr:NAD-dependent dehydratase [Crocinitomicaceae bacterium]|tara:strand:+ start:4429 stop:5001 length:573 start_codon:yes stop_codon:yes gene_type:complete